MILLLATALPLLAKEYSFPHTPEAADPALSVDRLIVVATDAGRLSVEGRVEAGDGGQAPSLQMLFSVGGSRMEYRLRWVRGNPLVVWFDPDLGIENQYVFVPEGQAGHLRAELWSSLQDPAGTPISDEKCLLWEQHPVIAALAEIRQQLPNASSRERRELTDNATFRTLFEVMTLVDPSSVALDCDHPPTGAQPDHWRDCFDQGDYETCAACCDEEYGLAAMCAGIACLVRPGWGCWTAAGVCSAIHHFEASTCAWMACDAKPGSPNCPNPPPDCNENGGDCYYTCPLGAKGHCGECAVENRVCCK